MPEGEAGARRPRGPAVVLRFPCRERPRPLRWWERWLLRLRHGAVR